MTTLAALPGPVAEAVAAHIEAAGTDFSDPDAVRGECETHSLALARALDGLELDDDCGEGARVTASAAQVWMERVPAALEANEMAGGHFVTHIEWRGLWYRVDLTAAQFPEMGWSGPRAREI